MHPYQPLAVLRGKQGSQSHRQRWRRVLSSGDSQYFQTASQISQISLLLSCDLRCRLVWAASLGFSRW